MGIRQELVLANTLKFTKKIPLEKLHFLRLPRQLLWEKWSVSYIFQAIIVIVVIKILEKHLCSSVFLANS